MRKFTLLIASLFITIGAMAQTPVLTIESPDVSAGPVELTAEQVSAIRSCNGAVTIVADVTITNSSNNAVLFGAITDYTSTDTGTSNIIGLGTGGNGYRIHAGTNGSHFWTKANREGTAISTSTERLFYVVNGSNVTVYAENGNNNFVNINLETSNIFSDNYAGENSKFYLGGIVHSTSTNYAEFKNTGTINSVSFYNGAYTPLSLEQAKALAIVDGVEGKVGYPVESVINTYKETVNNATTVSEIETAKTTLYASTEVNLPEDGGTYTFTFVDLEGEKHYINYNGSALTLVKLEEGATIPHTAMFRTYLNEDGETYSVRTYKNNFIRYPKLGAPVSTTDKYTEMSFDKMLKSGNYVSVENDVLFGLMRIKSIGGGDLLRTFVAYKTNFDNSTGYHFEHRNNNYYTTAIKIEKVDVPVYGKYYRLKGSSGNYVDAVNLYNNNNQMGLSSEAGDGTIFYFDRNMTLINYATGTPITDTRHIADTNGTGNPWAFFPSTSHEGKFKVVNVSNQYYLHDNSGNRADRCDNDAANHSDTHSWSIENVISLPVTITAAQYATFYAPVEVTVPDEVEAYYVTTDGVNSTYITLTKIDNRIVPANTGVILYAEAGTYNLEITSTGAATIADNLLEGTVAATYVTDDAYVLSNKDGEVGLYKATKNQSSNTAWKNNSHKAYLPVSAVPAAAQTSNGFRFGEGTTGIDEITDNREQSTVIYDLTGRRVEAITAPGIYIVGGKKVLVK